MTSRLLPGHFGDPEAEFQSRLANPEIIHISRQMDELNAKFATNLRLLSGSTRQREALVDQCRNMAEEMKDLKQAMILELQSVEDEQLRVQIEGDIREKLALFKKQLSQLEIKRNEVNRFQLEQEGTASALAASDEVTAQQLMQAGDRIQDQTEQSVHRMRQMVDEAEEVGVATGQRIDEQNEQILRISEGVEQIESNTKKSRKTVKEIAKGVCHDRCVQCLCLFNILFFIAVVAMLASNNKK